MTPDRCYFVYILMNEGGSTLYIGVTSNLPVNPHLVDLVDAAARRMADVR